MLSKYVLLLLNNTGSRNDKVQIFITPLDIYNNIIVVKYLVTNIFTEPGIIGLTVQFVCKIK